MTAEALFRQLGLDGVPLWLMLAAFVRTSLGRQTRKDLVALSISDAPALTLTDSQSAQDGVAHDRTGP